MKSKALETQLKLSLFYFFNLPFSVFLKCQGENYYSDCLASTKLEAKHIPVMLPRVLVGQHLLSCKGSISGELRFLKLELYQDFDFNFWEMPK